MYTKGEWKKESNIVKCFKRGVICRCPSPTTEDGVFEFQSNAQLISAAPDMYEVLQDIRDGVVNNQERIGHDRFDKLIKALSKAEGK
jgi:hypothetical protein